MHLSRLRNTFYVLLSLLLFLATPGVSYASFVPNPQKDTLPSAINSEFPELFPVLSEDASILIFSRENHPRNRGDQNLSDIWMSQLEQPQAWQEAKNLASPINSPQVNHPVGLLQDGQLLFYLSETPGKPGLHLFRCRKHGRLWLNAKEVHIPEIASLGTLFQVSIGPNSNSILLTIENPSGQKQLFKTDRISEDSWETPQLISPDLADRDIWFGRLIGDGKTVFFTERNPDRSFSLWKMELPQKQNPERIDLPGISASHQGFFSFDTESNQFYFAQQTPSGNWDIVAETPREISFVNDKQTVRGRVLNAATQSPLNATIQLYDERKGEVVQETKAEGSYLIQYPPSEALVLEASRPGFLPVTKFVRPDPGMVEEELDFFEADLEALQDNYSGDAQRINKIAASLEKIDDELLSINRSPSSQVEARKTLRNWEDRKKRNFDDLENKYQTWANIVKEINEEDIVAEPSEQQLPKEESELERLKRQFNTYSNHQKEEKQCAVPTNQIAAEPDEELTALRQKYLTLVNPQGKILPEPDLGDKEIPSFDALRTDAQLAAEAIAMQELEGQVKREAQIELKREFLKAYGEGLPPRWLEAHFEEAWKSVSVSLPSSSNTRTSNDLYFKDEYIQELEKEMRSRLEKEVRQQLRKELYPLVVEELKREITLQLKKELQEELRLELKKSLRQNVRDEAGDAYWTTDKTNTTIDPRDGLLIQQQDFYLLPMEIGQSFPLESVHFPANKTILTPAARMALEPVVDFLKLYPFLYMEVGGHTNNQCTEEFAMVLSELRAQIVAEYLISQGIPATQITYKGYGFSKPIGQSNNPSDLQRNQRIALTIKGIER